MRRTVIPLVISLILSITLACNLLTPPESPTATAKVEPGPTHSPSLTPAPPKEATATTEPGPSPTPLPSPTPTSAAEATPTTEPETRPPPATPKPPPEGPPAPTSLNVPLQVHNPLDVARTDEPVTSGLPLPRGLGLTDLSNLRLVDAAGSPVPAQFTPLARWGGSANDTSKPVRWVLIDLQATVDPRDTVYYYLQEGGPGPTPPHTLTITGDADAITVDTGIARFSISKADGNLTAPGLSAPILGRAVGTDGTSYTTVGPVAVTVELNGAMRAAVHVKGTFRDANGAPLVDYTGRYWFYAGRSTVRIFHTIENNTLCPLAEYGQMDCYDIGSGGSVAFNDLSLVLPTDLGGGLTYQVDGQSGELTEELTLYQDSSGTDHWDHYPTLADWDGNRLDARPRMQTYVSFRGYRTTLGEAAIDSGDRAAGWLSVSGGNGTWAVGVRDFWQNYPKALRAAPGGALEIGLFPGEFGSDRYAFTLRAGEHKTHEILLFPNSQIPSPPTSPLFASAPPAWYIDSGAFGLTALLNPTDWPDYENYVQYQLDTAPTYEEWMDWYPNLLAAIESTDFYGIYDYGDWPIDYEGYGVAPFNLKYDSDYGAWLQWVRSGDPRWFRLAEAADRHVADVDILHNLHSPRHWADGIAFGHSYHDEDGFANPHRNYGGNHPDTAFGMKGLLLTYYLTGYAKAYQSALELANCIEYRLHNDRHLCDQFADCSGEGYGLEESPGLYEAGSRPAANGLSIAIEAYRATGDPRYLTVADAVVNWARAGNQPFIDGPTGEELMMRPWMLNTYLRALAGYIEMRAEFDMPDEFGARDSYLAYAGWLRTYAWLDLDPIDTGPRASYPYEWWFDGRTGDPNDEWAIGNNIPSINNWLLLGADAMAYAYRLSGDADYLARATTLFRTGTRDPFFEEDANTYSATKETVNGITFGHTFLHVWTQGK